MFKKQSKRQAREEQRLEKAIQELNERKDKDKKGSTKKDLSNSIIIEFYTKTFIIEL